MSKREHFWDEKKCYLFHFGSSFCSWDNQIMTFQISWHHKMPKHKTRNTFLWITWKVNTVYFPLCQLGQILIVLLINLSSLLSKYRRCAKKNKRAWTSFQIAVFVEFSHSFFPWIIWNKLAKFHYQTVFTFSRLFCKMYFLSYA